MTKLFSIATVLFLCSVSQADSQKFNLYSMFGTKVDGNFKDECAYLGAAIEETISELAKSNPGANVGKVAEQQFHLGSLVDVYETLCD